MISLALTACVEPDRRPEVADPADVDDEMLPAGPVACATPPVEQWIGTAYRVQDEYPDDVTATVTWQRASTAGCVDRYVPVGRAQYTFRIPGAQCSQSIDPPAHDVAAADGTLTIDRTTAPATYVGRGATTWPMTFTCTFDDGSMETSEIRGGDVWFDASGTIGARIEGERLLLDGSTCGQGHAGTRCTYAWSFDAVAP